MAGEQLDLEAIARRRTSASSSHVDAMDEPMPPEPTHYFTRGLSSEPRPEFVAWEHRTHDAGKALRALLLSMARSARAET